ncbi:MAG: hypothetical protein KAW41_01940 [Candidatus Diapherotrites archaeon]|nr:hypothetical protein [Candidatus Diapherotrites archaeon]
MYGVYVEEQKDNGMYVRTSFLPIRMIVGQKEPVSLGVEVRNRGRQTKSYSVSVKVPFAFGFDRSGLMREHRIRIKNVDPTKKKEAKFSIYGKFNITPGFYDFDVIVREHDERFDKITDQQHFPARLRVE